MVRCSHGCLFVQGGQFLVGTAPVRHTTAQVRRLKTQSAIKKGDIFPNNLSLTNCFLSVSLVYSFNKTGGVTECN